VSIAQPLDQPAAAHRHEGETLAPRQGLMPFRGNGGARGDK
jgi:hypothetical protein